MPDSFFHIKIKKDYAEELLNDLAKSGAIEILQEEVPAWQKQLVMKRMNAIASKQEDMLNEDDFFYGIDEANEKI